MDYLHVQADSPWYNYYLAGASIHFANSVNYNYQPKEDGNNRNLKTRIYRGSYMSAHVLLNLLNELGKRDKMRGLPSILSLFRNEFNKFNNTRARMLDSVYHMTLRLH